MSVRQSLEVIWMYIIGVVFVSIGLYMIAFLSSGTPIYAPMGFFLMVPGLFFATIGGFYGKKKLMQGERPVSIESKQLDQIKQNVVSQLKPAQPEDIKQIVGQKEGFEGRPAPQEAKPEAPKEPEKPAPGVMKIMVCPGCNFENPPTNIFCSSCGKRLRKTEGAEAPSSKSAGPKKARKKARKKSAKS